VSEESKEQEEVFDAGPMSGNRIRRRRIARNILRALYTLIAVTLAYGMIFVVRAEASSRLHEAAYKGDVEAMRDCLAWGANPNDDAMGENAPIFDAIHSQNPKAVKLLLDCNVNLEVETCCEGWSPEGEAEKDKNPEIRRLFQGR